MSAKKAIFGLCVISALMFSAFAAQGASAAVKGTTAFTCVQGAGTKTLWGAHCLASNPGGTAKQEYGHVAFAQDTETEGVCTNKTTEGKVANAILESEISGVLLKLTSTEVTCIEGRLTNKLTAGGEHFIDATGFIHYLNITTNQTGCVVTNQTEGKNENTGTILTTPVTGTTVGTGDAVKIQPASGTLFVKFKLTGCTNSVLNKTYEITGSVTAKTSGATLKTTEAETTAAGTLKTGGVEAGLAGELTIEAKDKNIAGDTLKPISATTVET
jgi:hypothetical protein